MFANLSKIPIKLGILLVGFSLLVVGCDSAGVKKKPNKNKVDEKIAFEAVDANLADRITNFDGSSSNSVKTAAPKSAPGFDITARVPPPTSVVSGEDEAASHLALSTSPSNGGPPKLYVGYKIADDQSLSTEPKYGGGIDIVSVTPSGLAAGGGAANTLQSPAVDVQALALEQTPGNDPDVLYAATAVDPDVTVPRAPQLHSIDVSSTDGFPSDPVTFDLVELLNNEDEGDSPGDVTKVAKSVVVDGNTAYAVSDEGTAHSIPTPSGYEIKEDNMNTAVSGTSGREYRSVTRAGSNTYALGLNGDIFNVDIGNNSESTTASLPNVTNTEGTAGDGIARLSSHNFGSGTRFLASLNENGLRVVNQKTGTVLFSGDEYATSAAATDNFVYVASNNGIAVYEVQDPEGNLEYLGTQPLNQLEDGGPSATKTVQINDIVVDPNGNGDNILYVAKGTDGVYKIVQNASSAWNP